MSYLLDTNPAPHDPGRIGVAHVGARGFDRGHHRGASRGTEGRRSNSLSAPGFAIGPPRYHSQKAHARWYLLR
jgi:hypothetical protein